MLNVIIKAILIYLFIMLTMRLMGKRQVGQLQPFDLVISIIIAEVASIPMANAGIPITYGIAPVITLLFLHNLLAFIMSKSEKARALFSGKSEFIVYKGKIDKKLMGKIDYNLNDLIEQLRIKNIINLNDIEYAVLETNGQLSVVLKPEKSPLTPADMSLTPVDTGFHYAVIMDGKLNQKNISLSQVNVEDLKQAVIKMGFENIENVFIATVNEAGQLCAQSHDGVLNAVHIKENNSNG